MPNWRNPHDYDFTQTLTAAQWAWEFLRRNPEYQREWRAFIAAWRALEAIVGYCGCRISKDGPLSVNATVIQ
jgi:hypothetical protein